MMIILVVATADSMAEWLRRRSPKPKIAGPDPESTRLMPELWRDRTPESHSDLAGVVTGADPRGHHTSWTQLNCTLSDFKKFFE